MLGIRVDRLQVPRARSSQKRPAPSDADFELNSGTRKGRFASVFIDSEVRTRAPRALTNFGIGTLASTAIALLLALPTTGAFAGPENGPPADSSASPRQEAQADSANKPAAPASKDSTESPAAKPSELAAPASNPAEKPIADSKPAAVEAPPTGQAAQSIDSEAKPASSINAPQQASQPSEAAKSAAEAKPAEAKPAEAKPSDTALTAAPAAPALPGPDAAIAELLRELPNGKFDRLIGGKKDRTQIEAFYSSRNYAPLWIADGKANGRATAAIDYLRHVDADGLDPADYPAPNFASLNTPADLADAEIKLTA